MDEGSFHPFIDFGGVFRDGYEGSGGEGRVGIGRVVDDARRAMKDEEVGKGRFVDVVQETKEVQGEEDGGKMEGLIADHPQEEMRTGDTDDEASPGLHASLPLVDSFLRFTPPSKRVVLLLVRPSIALVISFVP